MKLSTLGLCSLLLIGVCGISQAQTFAPSQGSPLNPTGVLVQSIAYEDEENDAVTEYDTTEDQAWEQEQNLNMERNQQPTQQPTQQPNQTQDLQDDQADDSYEEEADQQTDYD